MNRINCGSKNNRSLWSFIESNSIRYLSDPITSTWKHQEITCARSWMTANKVGKKVTYGLNQMPQTDTSNKLNLNNSFDCINFDESAAPLWRLDKKKSRWIKSLRKDTHVSYGLKTINSNILKVGAPMCRNADRSDIEDILYGRLHANKYKLLCLKCQQLTTTKQNRLYSFHETDFYWKIDWHDNSNLHSNYFDLHL